MSVMDKIVLYMAGTMDLGFVIGYLLSGQPAEALYWFGATVIESHSDLITNANAGGTGPHHFRPTPRKIGSLPP